MDALEFGAEMTKALAWPTAAAATLIYLRKPLAKWLEQRPDKVKVGSIELEWTAQVSKTEVALDQPGLPDPRNLEQADDLVALSRDEPATAVLRSSAKVEKALRRLLKPSGVDLTDTGIAGLAQIARRDGLISDRTATAVQGIATLRNLAVHAPTQVTPDQAREFIGIAKTTAIDVDVERRVSRNVYAGTDNINPRDVEALVEKEGAQRVADLAMQGDSPVKQRQVATALVMTGELSAATDVASQISNRAEARTVANAMLTYAAERPDAKQTVLDELERLRPRLRAPQRRDVREKAEELNLDLPSSWQPDEDTSGPTG